MSHKQLGLCLPVIGLEEAAWLYALYEDSKHQHASEKWVDNWDTSVRADTMPNRAATILVIIWNSKEFLLYHQTQHTYAVQLLLSIINTGGIDNG